MRRKNRQIKMTLDIPEEFDNDEDFLDAFGCTLDSNEWVMRIQADEDDEPSEVNISRVNMGDLEIEPEE